MNDFRVDKEACRKRQQRLVEEMQTLRVDRVIVTTPENIQWLSGARPGPLFQAAASLSLDGELLLVLPERALSDEFAADELIGYQAKWHSTLRNDQRAECNQVLQAALAGKAMAARIGVEFSNFSPLLQEQLDRPILDVEPILYSLRRRKEEDELRLMRQAISATEAMYARAREIIEPGISELEVYNQLQAVAVETFGEVTTYFGQDFQCNSRGGPPRDRAASAGELYILDLGAGFRGYFSDNARTIAVDGQPSESQQQAWEQIVQVFALVEQTVKPGVSCRELFEQAQQLLDQSRPWQFNHHLGHGVGLYPHEAPHLNPHWDDTFEEGDFFTAEPGLYHDELRHGIRLEQNYLVTSNGVELLTEFPLELAL